MANKTLLQVRTDSPAVKPIDPDECLILDQQTDQPEGEQSTVATLSELIATGGRMVVTDEAYETLYADSVVNVSASSITITVGSAMRNGSRLLIRRTAAYDGDPVTITPPSGATFEGLESIKLYGQYSFVELERISSTVFAIKDLKDEYVWDSETGAKVRRRWGRLSEKEFIITGPATAGTKVSVTHELSISDIRNVSGVYENTDGEIIPFGYISSSVLQTYLIVVHIYNTLLNVAASDTLSSVNLSASCKVVITYKEW